MFFSVSNFPVLCRFLIIVYQRVILMGKDKDFSVFIKSGHALYCFFLCCLFPFESTRGKNGKF